jgi:hypothetical protein
MNKYGGVERKFRDGGAFPHSWTDQLGDQNTDLGMGVRDYFAAKAMMVLLSKDDAPNDYALVARMSYQMAGAMLEEGGWK